MVARCDRNILGAEITAVDKDAVLHILVRQDSFGLSTFPVPAKLLIVLPIGLSTKLFASEQNGWKGHTQCWALPQLGLPCRASRHYPVDIAEQQQSIAAVFPKGRYQNAPLKRNAPLL